VYTSLSAYVWLASALSSLTFSGTRRSLGRGTVLRPRLAPTGSPRDPGGKVTNAGSPLGDPSACSAGEAPFRGVPASTFGIRFPRTDPAASMAHERFDHIASVCALLTSDRREDLPAGIGQAHCARTLLFTPAGTPVTGRPKPGSGRGCLLHALPASEDLTASIPPTAGAGQRLPPGGLRALAGIGRVAEW
jgi:hypothetical protein